MLGPWGVVAMANYDSVVGDPDQKEQRRQKLLRFLAGEAIATLVLLGAIASASRDGLPRIPRGC